MSTTDQYLIAKATTPNSVVLDFGCGDGRFLELLLERGIDARGIDIPSSRVAIERRDATRPDLGLAGRVRYVEVEDEIPLENDSIDLVVSNTVFEHLIALDPLLAEMARILRPGGMIFTVFPLGSCLIEQHCGLPLFQMIESRRWRLRYLKFAKAIGLYRHSATPEEMEHYCYENVFYRRQNEIIKLFRRHFGIVESDTEAYIKMKAQHWVDSHSPLKRVLGRWLTRRTRNLAPLVHVRYTAAFRMSEPMKRRVSTTL